MILRLLNPQGIAGLGVSICLALLLIVQKIETRHWKKQSGQFEQLDRADQAAFAQTVANYRAATDAARAADRSAADRIRGEQAAINERTANDYEIRIASARSRAGELRGKPETAADPGNGRTASVPGLSPSVAGPASAAPQAGLPAGDALVATEQAIQLDELIKWVRQQSSIDPNHDSAERKP